MYQSILIPIDIADIDKGKAMIDIAIKQSNQDSKIMLLYVIEDVPTWIASTIPNNVMDKSELSAFDQLNTLASIAPGQAKAYVRKGHPSRTILSMADEMDSELIIVASHKPGLQDYFLGSTAAKVVRHAKCSVLVVR